MTFAEIFQAAQPIVIPVSGAAIVWIGNEARKMYNDYVQHHVTQSKSAFTIAKAGDLLFDCVQWGAQTLVDSLKKNGGWNATAAADVKRQVLDRFHKIMTPGGLLELMSAWSMTDLDTFNTRVDTWLEQMVQTANNQKATAVAAQLNTILGTKP